MYASILHLTYNNIVDNLIYLLAFVALNPKGTSDQYLTTVLYCTVTPVPARQISNNCFLSFYLVSEPVP